MSRFNRQRAASLEERAEESAGELQASEIMRHASHCFWCGAGRRRVGLTRDHVKPVVAGGKFRDNIVPACGRCQTDRGIIARFYGELKVLRFAIAVRWGEFGYRKKRAASNSRKALVRQSAEIAELVAKWKAIEESRWGSSPSAELDLTIPELPKKAKPTEAA